MTIGKISDREGLAHEIIDSNTLAVLGVRLGIGR